MSKQVSQEQKIIDYMNRFGGITQFEALRDLGVMRLASRIFKPTQQRMRHKKRNDYRA